MSRRKKHTNGTHVGTQSAPAKSPQEMSLLESQERQRRLFESAMFGGPTWDGFGGSDLYFDLFQERYGNAGSGYWVPISLISDRKGGSNWPIFRNEVELAQYRQRSRIICRKNSYARSLLFNLQTHIVGKGFTYEIQPKEDADTAPEQPGVQPNPQDDQIVKRTQKFVDKFLMANRFTASVNPDPDASVVNSSREWESARRVWRDGEWILRLFFVDDEESGLRGMTFVRPVEPEQVTNPPQAGAELGWSYGMRHQTYPFEDEEDIKEYYVKYKDGGRDGQEGECVPASEIVHLKNLEEDAATKRGLPAFSLDMVDSLERASKLMRNVSTSSGVRAATAEIWQHENSSEAQVQSMATRMAERQFTNPITGRTETQERTRPGSTRRIPAGQKPVWPQAVGASEHLEVLQGDLRQAGIVFAAPEYMTGDASNNNMASSKEAGAPFVIASEVTQVHFKTAFMIVVLRAIKWGIKCGLLPENTLDVVELQVTAPTISVRDPLQTAQEDQILIGAKIKSVKTAQGERGLDPDHEAANNEEFDAKFGQQGGALPMPGDGGDPFGGGQQPPQPQPSGGQSGLESKEDDTEREPETGESLANLYASHLDVFGSSPPRSILKPILDELSGLGYSLVFNREQAKWLVSREKHPLTESIEILEDKGKTGTFTDVRGHKYRLENGRRVAMNHEEVKAKRQARGFNVADVKARTDPHKKVQLQSGYRMDTKAARRSYNALKSHHGELIGHRLDELSAEMHDYLTKLQSESPDETGRIKQAKQQLRLYGHMLKWGQDEGLIRDAEPVGGGVNGSGNFESSQRILTAREGTTRKADPETVPANLRQHLTPEQVQGVALAVPAMESQGGFLLADSTGVGKTRQEIAMASILAGKGKKVLLVSTAAILQPNWGKGSIDENTSMHKDSQKMGVGLTLNNGTKPLEAGQVHLTTYESLGKIKDKIDADTHVIFDEAHYIKNPDSQRGGHGKEISEKAGGVCYASATPADTPEDTAYMFRTKLFGDTPWAEVKKNFNADKNGAESVLRTIDEMFGKLTEQGLMIRREISLDNLEASFSQIELPQEAHDEIAKIKADAKAGGSKNAASAVMSARLSQEKHKVPAAVEHAMNEIKEGRQAVIFVASINAPEGSAKGTKGTAALLREQFAAKGMADVAEYHSGADATKDAVGKFNRGESKVLITTIPSGSTGINLDDTTGKTPRSIVVMTPPWTANENVQIPGRILRLTTKSKARMKYLFADTDVDRHNYGLLSEKMKTLGAVAEGELKRLDLPIPKRKDVQESLDSLQILESFTGVDAHGHHWVNGKQVAIDKDVGTGKQKRVAPGSQLQESHKAKLRELGMTGTFPPADVPLSSIKFADLSKGADELKTRSLESRGRKPSESFQGRDSGIDLLESGFTGVLTDRLGHKQHYQDGKHVAGPTAIDQTHHDHPKAPELAAQAVKLWGPNAKAKLEEAIAKHADDADPAAQRKVMAAKVALAGLAKQHDIGDFDLGKEFGEPEPANEKPKPLPAAPNAAPAPENVVKAKPHAKAEDAATLDAAHETVKKLYDSALTDDKIFEKTDAAMASIGEMTVPQLKTLASKFAINEVGKSKAEIVGNIGRKIKSRREQYDRTKVDHGDKPGLTDHVSAIKEAIKRSGDRENYPREESKRHVDSLRSLTKDEIATVLRQAGFTTSAKGKDAMLQALYDNLDAGHRAFERIQA